MYQLFLNINGSGKFKLLFAWGLDHTMTQLIWGVVSSTGIIQCHLDSCPTNCLQVSHACWSMLIFSTTRLPKQKQSLPDPYFTAATQSLRLCCACVRVTVAHDFPTPARHTWIPRWLHEAPFISIRIPLVPPCDHWSATLWHIHYVTSARPTSESVPCFLLQGFLHKSGLWNPF